MSRYCICECDCDCHTNDYSISLQEFLDANNHPGSERVKEFLQFFKNYYDNNIYDPDWYTKDRLLEKFNALNID